jgi:large subunit ribosomal protein L22
MAQAMARQEFIRMSPRKARLVADTIRGKSVEESRAILKTLPKKGSPIILKILNSAIANAEQKKDMDVSALYVKEITVDGGPYLARFKARAMGRGTPIRRPTSHVKIVLAEK